VVAQQLPLVVLPRPVAAWIWHSYRPDTCVPWCPMVSHGVDWSVLEIHVDTVNCQSWTCYKMAILDGFYPYRFDRRKSGCMIKVNEVLFSGNNMRIVEQLFGYGAFSMSIGGLCGVHICDSVSDTCHNTVSSSHGPLKIISPLSVTIAMCLPNVTSHPLSHSCTTAINDVCRCSKVCECRATYDKDGR
jgi:hypothetical protein